MDSLSVYDTGDEIVGERSCVQGLWECDCPIGESIHTDDESICSECGISADGDVGTEALLTDVIAEWALGSLELDPLDTITILEGALNRVIDGRLE